MVLRKHTTKESKIQQGLEFRFMQKILVSACLLGERCRYDGKSKPSQAVIRLFEAADLVPVPVCPEKLGGLPTPRTPCERCGGKILSEDGLDRTDAYLAGAETVLRMCLESGCKLAILKQKSPSCGSGQIYDGSFSGRLTEGYGVTSELLIRNGIKVIDENEAERFLLHDSENS